MKHAPIAAGRPTTRAAARVATTFVTVASSVVSLVRAIVVLDASPVAMCAINNVANAVVGNPRFHRVLAVRTAWSNAKTAKSGLPATKSTRTHHVVPSAPKNPKPRKTLTWRMKMQRRLLRPMAARLRRCLTFAPMAWLKLMWFCHAGDTEHRLLRGVASPVAHTTFR